MFFISSKIKSSHKYLVPCTTQNNREKRDERISCRATIGGKTTTIFNEITMSNGEVYS